MALKAFAVGINDAMVLRTLLPLILSAVLQRLAAAGVARLLICTSGNPAIAGLLAQTMVCYLGDFDWAGIAIARRVIDRGAVAVRPR